MGQLPPAAQELFFLDLAALGRQASVSAGSEQVEAVHSEAWIAQWVKTMQLVFAAESGTKECYRRTFCGAGLADFRTDSGVVAVLRRADWHTQASARQPTAASAHPYSEMRSCPYSA